MEKSVLQKAVWLMFVLAISYAGFSQSSGIVQVTGTVISAESRSPMQGVSVVIKGTRRGLATDSTGKFSVRIERGQTLEFRYVGFKSQSFKINHSEALYISMALNTTEN